MHNEPSQDVLWAYLDREAYLRALENPSQPEIDEIDRRIAAVRAAWSPNTEAARIVGSGGHIPWSLPVYCVNYVQGAPNGPGRRKDKRTKVYKRIE